MRTQIDHGGRGRPRLQRQRQRIAIKPIGRPSGDLAGETLIPIRADQRQDKRRLGRLHAPEHPVEANRATMQRRVPVVLHKLIPLSVQFEGRPRDPVGIPPQQAAKRPPDLAIGRDVIETEQHIVATSVPVGCLDPDHAAAEICDLHA